LANPAVRQAYDAQAPQFELARELIAARTKAGLTQGDAAARMGTTQSVVARI
jgi:predicted transcriptional regulator